jgi:hypothetical protein
VVLLVLAIVWGVLLVSWLRSRGERSFSDSVGTFRRHLTVLERATPATVAPANRLRSGPIGGRAIPPYRPTAPSNRPATPLARGQRPAGLARTASPRLSRDLRSPAAARLRHRQAQRRRRDVLFALVAGAIGSLLLALIPGVSVMWPVQVLFDVLLVAYVALLIRMRNLAAERELKLTFLPPQQLNRPRPSYEFGGGYGDLEFRRAVN